MAFLAYYLNWPRADLLRLDHAERRRWCAEVSGINRALEAEPATGAVPLDRMR